MTDPIDDAQARLVRWPDDEPPDNVIRAVQGIHHCTADEAREIIARDVAAFRALPRPLPGEDRDQTAPFSIRQVEVKKYGITRDLLDLRHAEQEIGAATGELYAMLQRDGQTQCHRLRVRVVAYVDVDALPTELQAGIIPEEVNVVTHHVSEPYS
jgi:hypothetical protein